jgi:hypothetical protein
MPRRKSRGTLLLIGIDTGIHIGCADAYLQVTDADVIIFGSKEFSQSRGPPIGRRPHKKFITASSQGNTEAIDRLKALPIIRLSSKDLLLPKLIRTPDCLGLRDSSVGRSGHVANLMSGYSHAETEGTKQWMKEQPFV